MRNYVIFDYIRISNTNLMQSRSLKEDNVACLLKAGTVEPKKRQLLDNGCVTRNSGLSWKRCFLRGPRRCYITGTRCHYKTFMRRQ
jgi:hypothetical protein